MEGMFTGIVFILHDSSTKDETGLPNTINYSKYSGIPSVSKC